MNNLIKVGTFKLEYNAILGTNFPTWDIVQSTALRQHLINQNHNNCLPYINQIPDILNDPTYIGQNSRHLNSIEIVKEYNNNILVALKLDNSMGYWYVASIYDVSNSKIQRRLHSGRLRVY